MAKVIKLKNDAYLYGTIFEKGSNSNGDYIKFSDGTLVCYGDKDLGDVTINNSHMNMYISSSQSSIAYPVSFAERPKYRCITPQGGSGSFFIIQTNVGNKTGTGTYYLLRGNSATITNASVGYFAIGKWK